jgi:hypothetical protein
VPLRDLLNKCEDLLDDIGEYEGELLDSLSAIRAYRARVYEIMQSHGYSEAPDATFEEIRAFLARKEGTQ